MKIDYRTYSFLSEMEYFKGELSLVHRERTDEEKYISTHEDDLFFRVPKYLLSCIDGCPSRITPVIIQVDEGEGRMTFIARQANDDNGHFTQTVILDKVLR